MQNQKCQTLIHFYEIIFIEGKEDIRLTYSKISLSLKGNFKLFPRNNVFLKKFNNRKIGIWLMVIKTQNRNCNFKDCFHYEYIESIS